IPDVREDRSVRGVSCVEQLGLYVGCMSNTMMIIRKYTNELEAIVAKNVLEANEIDSVVLRDDAGGMLPVLHLLYPVRLAVRAVDAPRAEEILSSAVEMSDEANGTEDSSDGDASSGK
ncbi:MAG: DUF2007 domain-containing protein, partial [Gemmatimonadaceae bacterium]